MQPVEFERMLVRFTNQELISYMMNNSFLQREMKCVHCKVFMELKSYEQVKEKLVWRCNNTLCPKYRNRTSIRHLSFFSDLTIDFLSFFQLLISWEQGQAITLSANFLNISRPTASKIKNKIVNRMGEPKFENDKLGGPGKIINIDETMLNYKCKSHRGRSPDNKTDALVIVECVPHVVRVLAKVIPDKCASTILPIVIANVVSGSTIFTDEHRSYSALTSLGFEHGTVCHKFNFVDRMTGVHTQHVESLNNCIKQEIKKQKGVSTSSRQKFLNEFCWFFNNKERRLEKLLILVKI